MRFPREKQLKYILLLWAFSSTLLQRFVDATTPEVDVFDENNDNDDTVVAADDDNDDTVVADDDDNDDTVAAADDEDDDNGGTEGKEREENKDEDDGLDKDEEGNDEDVTKREDGGSDFTLFDNDKDRGVVFEVDGCKEVTVLFVLGIADKGTQEILIGILGSSKLIGMSLIHLLPLIRVKLLELFISSAGLTICVDFLVAILVSSVKVCEILLTEIDGQDFLLETDAGGREYLLIVEIEEPFAVNSLFLLQELM